MHKKTIQGSLEDKLEWETWKEASEHEGKRSNKA